MAWPVIGDRRSLRRVETSPLVGLLEPLAAGGAQGPSAVVLFVVGGRGRHIRFLRWDVIRGPSLAWGGRSRHISSGAPTAATSKWAGHSPAATRRPAGHRCRLGTSGHRSGRGAASPPRNHPPRPAEPPSVEAPGQGPVFAAEWPSGWFAAMVSASTLRPAERWRRGEGRARRGALVGPAPCGREVGRFVVVVDLRSISDMDPEGRLWAVAIAQTSPARTRGRPGPQRRMRMRPPGPAPTPINNYVGALAKGTTD